MKKLCLMGAFLFSIFTAQTVYSQDCCAPCAPPCDSPCDERTGECFCRYVHYEACPYTTKRCVTETIPCSRRCCQMVPQYYPVQRCRMVPEYYTVSCCRQVPVYYDVPECKYVNRVICEPACRYCPRYYWKRECQPCANPAPCCP